MEERIGALRTELADWERDFKSFHNRKPTTQDAPPQVLSKYRELASLKKKNDELKAQRTQSEKEVVILPKIETLTKREVTATLRSLTASFANTEYKMESTARSIATSRKSSNNSSGSLVLIPNIKRMDSSLCDTGKVARSETITRSTMAENDTTNSSPAGHHDGVDSRHEESTDLFSQEENNVSKPCSTIVAKTSRHTVTESDFFDSDDASDDDSASLSSVDSSEGENHEHVMKPALTTSALCKPSQEKVFPSESGITANQDVTPFYKAFSKSEPNFVRMNMKRGWRAKKRLPSNPSMKAKNKSRTFFTTGDEEFRSEKPDDVIQTVVDVLDKKDSTMKSGLERVPRCGHNIPCIELVVKKASTGNKGRSFYGCSLGREGSCGFFLWKDDTPEAAKTAFTSRFKTAAADGNFASTTGSVSTPKYDLPKWIALSSVSELKLHLRRLKGKTTNLKKKSELISTVQELWISRMNEARAMSSDDIADVEQVLHGVFFHEDFLAGQREAIEQVLSGMNTLVVRATGSGKSLTYQLPAFVFSGITIVISPLISLMQDQISQLPPGLRGCALSGTQKEQAEALADLLSGTAKLLFISPERLFTGSFQTLMKKLPAVSMVCIDEAHCISSWSHNFRPSYLRLGDAIRAMFPLAVLLALTATATSAVQQEICDTLGIERTTGVKLEGSWNRQNLELVVQPAPPSEDKRVSALVDTLKNSNIVRKKMKTSSSSAVDAPAKGIDATIVYATTKSDTRVVAERLENHGLSASPYHSGMDAAERKKTQADFICSKLPIVVATVAFGMGLNKPDVRRVIHYRVPRSIEEYVQEIGRAGRDGLLANCICFFDVEGEESRRLLSLARSDGVEPIQLKALVSALSSILKENEFTPLYVNESVQNFDCKESVLETILVFLKREGIVDLGANGYGRAEINFGPDKENAPPIIKFARRLASFEGGKCKVDLHRLSLSLSGGKSSRPIASIIRELCEAREKEYIVSFSLIDRCWYVKKVGAWMMEDTVATILPRLTRYCLQLEERLCQKIQAVYSVMKIGLRDGEAMKTQITNYLQGEGDFQIAHEVPFDTFDDISKRALLGDVQSLVRDPFFTAIPKHLRTARAIGRILHAVTSPAFPFEKWSTHRLWGRYKRYSFEKVMGSIQPVLDKTLTLEDEK